MNAVTDENTPISRAAKDHGVPVSTEFLGRYPVVTNKDPSHCCQLLKNKNLPPFWWKFPKLGMERQEMKYGVLQGEWP